MLSAMGLFCIVLVPTANFAAQDAAQVLELNPSDGNPRNSEGDFIQLKDGAILFVYTHFTGGGGDHSAACLASRRSEDGGKSWSVTDETVVANEGDFNVMSVSLLRLKSGEIALFYLRKNSEEDCRPYLRRSFDEGKTWSEPARCLPRDGYFVVNNDRVIQLDNGRIVIPAALHGLPGKGFFGRGISMCFLSDDNGETWRQSETELEAPEDSKSGLQEPGVIQLHDGRLMMLCRTDQGCQMRSYSEDRGNTWSPAEKTDIMSPVSPATFEYIPGTNDILMAWNDHSNVAPEILGKRTPFTTAISQDGGETWGHRKTIEDDPHGWYCYTAMEFVGGHVLLGHCAGDRRTGGLNRTQVLRIPIESLYSE